MNSRIQDDWTIAHAEQKPRSTHSKTANSGIAAWGRYTYELTILINLRISDDYKFVFNVTFFLNLDVW
jgi:hypothetical protein